MAGVHEVGYALRSYLPTLPRQAINFMDSSKDFREVYKKHGATFPEELGWMSWLDLFIALEKRYEILMRCDDRTKRENREVAAIEEIKAWME